MNRLVISRSGRLLVAFALAAGVSTLTGCSGAPDTTCADYLALPLLSSERGDIQTKLLRAHDLDPGAISNIANIDDAIRNGCRRSSSSTKIDQVIDWESPTW